MLLRSITSLLPAGRADRFAVAAVVAFGLLNALLYPLLLPLWEGYDEPFHFAYVQTLAVRGRLPVLGSAAVSEEVMRSIALAPASAAVQHNLPQSRTFAQFSALPEAVRYELRNELRTLPTALRGVEAPGTVNYEAQQAPLAYLVLAPFEALWAGVPLVPRVVLLRFVGVFAALIAQALLTLALARRLKVEERLWPLVLLLVLGCQMFYGAVAHVANDWLAVPLSTAVLVAVLRLMDEPRAKTAFAAGAVAAAGLLTKAYFLSWALFACCAVAWLLWRRRLALTGLVAFAAPLIVFAAPWYARNLMLYGNLSGMQQATAGFGPVQAFHAALALPWGTALLAAARGAVWTGNGSFTSFGRGTVDLLLLCGMAGFAAWLWRRKSPATVWAAAACGLFFLALQYAGLIFYEHSGRAMQVATPWYYQCLAAPLACLCVVSLRGRERLAAAAAGLLSAYLMAATYVIKLVPMYGGYTEGSMRLSRLVAFHREASILERGILADTIPGPAGLVMVLVGVVAVVALPLGGWIGWRAISAPAGSGTVPPGGAR